MIDFISATIYQCKYTPNFGNCILDACYPNGWSVYSLMGCERMMVRWNENSHRLDVKGSLPYFLKGHNFTFSAKELGCAVDLIDTLLGGVGLWGATVRELENGHIMEVEAKPKTYIQNHYAKKGSRLLMNEKARDRGNFRWWEDGSEAIKMYDAKMNLLHKTDLKRRDAIISAGCNPELNYLKFESHINKPYVLSGGKDFLMEYLSHPRWIEILNRHLIDDYNRLDPMKTLELPTNKKGLTSADLLLYSLADLVMNVQGKPLAEAKKQVFKHINLIPDTLLTKADKDARKRQISGYFKKLKESDTSEWDLTRRLEIAICDEALEHKNTIHESMRAAVNNDSLNAEAV